MKNAIILHGTGDRPDQYWFPYVKQTLEKHGYEVWLPALPHAEKPNLADWLPLVMEQGKFSENTILIGHSAGSELILSILEKLEKPVKQAVLVSGYAQALRKNRDSEERAALDWEKMKHKAAQLTFINSDNDPWGCDDTQGRIMLDRLGGILVIPKGEGHMGSTSFKQPYTEFPLLVKLLDI